MITYLLIFIFKILENALGTLRLILISNNKKHIGALLQLIISLIWIISTSLVIIDINKDIMKIIFFILGSYIGSYIGSIIEEKLALGSNLIIAITNKECGSMIRSLRKKGFALTTFNGKGKKQFKTILIIVVKRKRKNQLIRIIKSFDENVMIISEKANAFGGYH